MQDKPVICYTVKDWLNIRRELQRSERSIGFVPTMGALHAGHASLLRRSRQENQVSVLSIYVNPTQFDNRDDLTKYPQTLDLDTQMARELEVDFVLLPPYEEIYSDGYRFRMTEGEFSRKLCGLHRPGHFDGVLTVVMKLFNIVQPTRAYFGEKDYQQLQLVRDMSRAYFMDVEVVSCPTVREADGLAMSSRNRRLSPSARQLAPRFAKILREASSALKAEVALQKEGFEVDYVEDIERRRFGAVKLENVRLIDNLTTESATTL